MTSPLPSPEFWTSFSDPLRTALKSTLTTTSLGSIIENPSSPTTLALISTTASQFLQQQKYDLAEELLSYSLTHPTFSDGEKHTMKYNIAYAQMQQGKYAQSEISWRELISSTSTSDLEDGKKKLSNLGERSNLAVALNEQKKFVEAEEVIMGLLPELQDKFGEVDPRTMGCRRHLMSALVGQGRLDEARALFWDMMEKSKRCEEVHREEEIEAVEEFRGKLVEV